MRQTLELIKRNFRLYVRDKSAVSFSLLTMLIVIGLMVLFLGDMNINNIVNLLEEMGVSDLETGRENAALLILTWTLAGVTAMNSITVSISILGIMVQDQNSGRFQSFYTSPISRFKLSLGYIGASILGSSLICFITLIISDLLISINGGEVLSLLAHSKLIGIIIINSFCYSGLMYFVAQFIHSDNAWSAFSTIVGTLAGFLGAIYLPMGALPAAVQTILKCTPILHSTALLRTVFTESILAKTFYGLPDTIISEYQEVMGITVASGKHILNPGVQVALLCLCGIIILIVSATVMKRRKVSDR